MFTVGDFSGGQDSAWVLWPVCRYTMPYAARGTALCVLTPFYQSNMNIFSSLFYHLLWEQTRRAGLHSQQSSLNLGHPGPWCWFSGFSFDRFWPHQEPPQDLKLEMFSRPDNTVWFYSKWLRSQILYKPGLGAPIISDQKALILKRQRDKRGRWEKKNR